MSTPKRCRIPFLNVLPEVKTSAGNIYSKRVLEIIFDEQLPAKLPLFGCLGHPLDGRTRITEAAFTLLAVDRPNSLYLFGDLEFLSTERGRLSAELYDGSLSLALAVRLLGTKAADGRIDEIGLRVAGVDIICPDGPILSPLDIIARRMLSEGDQLDHCLVRP